MNPLTWLILLVVVALGVWFVFRHVMPKGGPSDGAMSSAPCADDPSRFGMHLDASSGVMLDASSDHVAAHGHYLATACKLAYLSGEEAHDQYRDQLNLHARLLSVDNTQVYIGQNASSIVVAFRGSEKPTSVDGCKDWLLTNARNFLVLPEGRIGTDFAAAGVGARFHRGFMSALDEIWLPLKTRVSEAMQHSERPIWITGHSLGGAIALLAAWRFHQHFLPVHRICTFGAPMIGNNMAAEAYHNEFPGKIIRYVDHSDMVPRLPATSLLNNQYDHVQREIVLGGDGIGAGSANHLLSAAALQAPNKDDSGESSLGVDPHLSDGLWNDLHTGIAAHLMGNYLTRISEQMA